MGDVAPILQDCCCFDLWERRRFGPEDQSFMRWKIGDGTLVWFKSPRMGQVLSSKERSKESEIQGNQLNRARYRWSGGGSMMLCNKFCLAGTQVVVTHSTIQTFSFNPAGGGPTSHLPPGGGGA